MRETILVVDDDLILLQLLENILGDIYRVSLAKSGFQALLLLQKGYVPDLILLDVDMPKMDGYETLKKIRELEAAKEIPVLFLTGMQENEAELKGLRSGACDYIRKPFEKEILKTRIEIHIKQANRQKALAQSEETGQKKGEKLRKILTETEWKVADLIAQGYTNREIGERLGYSYNYVKKVTTRIFDKLDLEKRSELKYKM